MQPVAILSTTVLPLDGLYHVHSLGPVASQALWDGKGYGYLLPLSFVPDEMAAALPGGAALTFIGVPHYVGHPATKALVEAAGAVPAPTRLFPGLEVGECALCVPIVQGQSTRATEGVTTPNQAVEISQLAIRVLMRVA